MNAKHSFKPNAFDVLESREVMSTLHFGMAHAALVHHAAPTHSAHTLHISPRGHFSTTTVAPVNTPSQVNTPSPTITMPNVSQDLNGVYNAFQGNGGNVAQVATQFPNIQFQGNSVGVTVKGQGSFGTLVSQLQSAGMTITASNANADLVVGYVPVSALPTISTLSSTASVSPMYKPTLFSPSAPAPTASTGAMTVRHTPNYFSSGGTIAYLE